MAQIWNIQGVTPALIWFFSGATSLCVYSLETPYAVQQLHQLKTRDNRKAESKIILIRIS